MTVPVVTESGGGRNFSRYVLVGYLVAAVGFALLFVVLAKFIPVFDRFALSPQGRFLAPISILLICFGGLLRYRARAKSETSMRKELHKVERNVGEVDL
jgi:hypothetical protein